MQLEVFGCALLISTGVAWSQVSGTVTSVNGTPLAAAIVVGRGFRDAETDPAGRYNLLEPGDTLVIHASGYHMAVKAVGASESPVDIALEPLGKPSWSVPTCSLSADKQTIGSRMRLSTKRRVKVVRDVDYYEDWIQFHLNGKKYYMRLMVGPFASDGWPLPDPYRNSISFSERLWAGGGLQGLDARGVRHDGLVWRWVGPAAGEFVSYEGASQEAARAFDSIVDSMCISVSSSPW